MTERTSDFETAMRQAGPRIFTLAVRLCGNQADGQDLAQETFVKAYEHWEAFQGKADPSSWFYRICVNCWKNRVRYERRRAFWKHFSLDGGGDDPDKPVREFASGESPLGESLEKAEELRALHQALAEMKADDRAILVLYEMEGRSYEEIADVLEVPMGTVRSRLARSREKLRDLLEARLKRIT